jgi:type II secretory pathway pseudopilin PulG
MRVRTSELEQVRKKVFAMKTFPVTNSGITRRRRTLRDRSSAERGYVLLTLLLMVAMMIIAAGAVVQTIAFEIKRDREEEMVHRGVQYARAIRSYYKKFGRYPTKLEDLESANNLRFLRKRYKDPITGKDFKLLHYGEAKLTLSNLLGGGGIPGANPIGGSSGLNGSSGFGGAGGSSGAGGLSGLSGSSTFGSSSGFGGGMNSGFGSSNSQANPQGSNSLGSNSQSSNQGAGNQGAGTDPSDPSAAGLSVSDQNTNGLSASGDKLSSTVFGGGPIVGVVSISKKESIREYDHKKKYDQWQFVYDPALDRGGLIKGPNQTLPMFTQNPLQPGQTGQPGQPGNNSPFGSSTGMGGSSSFGGSNNSSFGGNNNSSFGGSNQGTQPPPPTSPPQQQ